MLKNSFKTAFLIVCAVQLTLLTTPAPSLATCLTDSLSAVAGAKTSATARAVASYPEFEVNRLEKLDVPVSDAQRLYSDLRASKARRKDYFPSVYEEMKAKRDEDVKPMIRALIREFRKDPNLSSYSDTDLAKAAFRALGRAYEVSPGIDDYSPGYDLKYALIMEKYRFYLRKAGIDPDARPASFQKMLRQFGQETLTHATDAEHLASLLALGRLQPRAKTGASTRFSSGAEAYNYLEVLFDPRTGLAELPIRLDFSSAILDEVPWSHFNVAWKYGRRSEGHSIEPSNMLAGFFNAARSHRVIPYPEAPRYTEETGYLARHEFLFTGDIDLRRYLKAIHVPAEKKADVLERLRAAKVDPFFIKLIQ